MNRISPRVLGILVVLGGICAALPFQRRASRHVTVEPAAKSETIQWRSNDFTLAVAVQDQPMNSSPYADDHPKSPAFGGAGGVTVHSQASLDDIIQPPALAGAYEAAAAIAAIGTASLEESGEQAGTTRAAKVDSSGAAATPLQSVAITHEITDGDTLEALAEEYLGSRLRWTEIYNANPEILDNPEVLPVGVTIVILPGMRPSTPASSHETDSLVPVRSSDLLEFRSATE